MTLTMSPAKRDEFEGVLNKIDTWRGATFRAGTGMGVLALVFAIGYAAELLVPDLETGLTYLYPFVFASFAIYMFAADKNLSKPTHAG